MAEYIQVFTTTGKREDARKIAREVVEKRLAACAQVLGPVASTFRWKDNIDEDEEWLLIMKTRKDLYEEVEKLVNGVHPYEVPEILALQVVAGNRSYLDWLEKEVKH